jgi:hypothetical protein
VHLAEVRELAESVCVAQRDEDDAVVREGADRVLDGDLLPAAWASGADERTGILARERALPPKAARGVPERLRSAASC